MFNKLVTRHLLGQLRRESFLNGQNILYLEKQFSEWKQNPQSVSISLQFFFKNLMDGVPIE